MDLNHGKLLVYAPKLAKIRKRLKQVNMAVAKTAKTLNLDYEVVPLKGRETPIYVYYKDNGEEPVPIYCHSKDENNSEKICMALRSMIFVLSFHPKYPALKKIRKAIIRFS